MAAIDWMFLEDLVSDFESWRRTPSGTSSSVALESMAGCLRFVVTDLERDDTAGVDSWGHLDTKTSYEPLDGLDSALAVRVFDLQLSSGVLAVTFESDCTPLVWMAQSQGTLTTMESSGLHILRVVGGLLLPLPPDLPERLRELDFECHFVIQDADGTALTTEARFGSSITHARPDRPELVLRVSMDTLEAYLDGEETVANLWAEGAIRFEGDLAHLEALVRLASRP